MLEHVKNYYENLFTCYSIDSNLVDMDLKNIIHFNSPKLKKQLDTGLEKDITEAEVLNVVLKKGKTRNPLVVMVILLNYIIFFLKS